MLKLERKTVKYKFKLTAVALAPRRIRPSFPAILVSSR